MVAFELLFGVQQIDIFPELISEIELGVLDRARILYDDLQGDPSDTTRLKLDFLETVFARLDRKASQNDV